MIGIEDKIATNLPKSWSDLSQVNADAMAEYQILAAVLALGSNHNAAHYFDIAHQKLSQLGDIQASKRLLNADFTSTKAVPKPDYTNQAIFVKLAQPLKLAELEQILKAIEQEGCDRLRDPSQPKVLVTMDIDILLIKTKAPSWMRLANRDPLKAHERLGLAELGILEG